MIIKYSTLAVTSFLLMAAHSSHGCTKINQPSFNEATYYSGLENLREQDLLSALNQRIRNHTRYDYTPCVWEILKEADESPSNPNAVRGFYTQRDILKVDRDRGSNTPDYWNREHIWPKSHGFKSKSQHAHTDTHALRATDKSVNADRGNKDFANGGSSHYECTSCKTTTTTWEPGDAQKGDTARMMFYMDTRYEGGDSSGVSDLDLVDRTTSVGQTRMGKLCDLVQWHLDDPVTTEEVQRNNIIYSWQGNRNPFIDHPEYVVRIWGNACGIEEPVIEEPPVAETDEDVPLPLWALGLLAAGFFGLKRKALNH